MKENICNDQINGYGCYINDTGILIEDCEFKSNEQGGIFVSCVAPKAEKLIGEDIRQFLERFPMIVYINRCECTLNSRTGLVVEEFWKGPVIVHESKFIQNKHSGIMLSSLYHPPNEMSLFRSSRANDISSLLSSFPRRLANS